MNYYLEVLKKYAVFSGRARRKEYWMFLLFNLIITFVLLLIDSLMGTFRMGTFSPQAGSLSETRLPVFSVLGNSQSHKGIERAGSVTDPALHVPG